jgi:hypothetical protein
MPMLAGNNYGGNGMITEYIGPLCVLCGTTACDGEPGAKKHPAFCPMPIEAELLEQVEGAYHNQEDLHRLSLESART